MVHEISQKIGAKLVFLSVSHKGRVCPGLITCRDRASGKHSLQSQTGYFPLSVSHLGPSLALDKVEPCLTLCGLCRTLDYSSILRTIYVSYSNKKRKRFPHQKMVPTPCLGILVVPGRALSYQGRQGATRYDKVRCQGMVWKPSPGIGLCRTWSNLV